MIKFSKMWKNFKQYKKTTRIIKEVEFSNINLKEYTLIDVRSKREFSENHLNGAINIPLSDLKRNIEKIVKDKNKKILVYCKSGMRSAKAIEIMNDLGYKDVYNLKGGLENI